MNREEYLLIQAVEACKNLGERMTETRLFGVEKVQVDQDNAKQLKNRIYANYYELRAVLGMLGIDAWDSSQKARDAEQEEVARLEAGWDLRVW